MADKAKETYLITEPGIVSMGKGLPVGPSIQSYFSDETIKQVACGPNDSAVVCDPGKVFTFGLTELEPDTVTAPKLVATLAAIRISQVACGCQLTVFLADEGQLYSCGVNSSGQLGLGHTKDIPSPVLVNGLPPIKKVAAGDYHTVALTDSGEVWVTGHNKEGQLGVGHTNNIISFTLVPNLAEPIIDISCGGRHTALLSKSNALLMTGYNQYGQLGLDTIQSVSTFTQVLLSSVVVAVSCGECHTVALGADETVLVWGRNNCGQLGTGNTTDISTPAQMTGLENHTITKVFAGENHTALLTEQGDILVCGKGSDGELGQGKQNFLVATLLPKSPGLVIKQVVFTYAYSLMLVGPKPNISPPTQCRCGGILKDDPAIGCITNWEKSIMQSLECPVCLKIMCSPIHQCLNGHSLCDLCRSNINIAVCPMCQEDFGRGRNFALESLSMEIQLPCVECLQRIPTCELEQHAEICPNRKYRCPINETWGWRGRPDTMLAHTTSVHPDQMWRNLPRLFRHSTSDNLVHTDLLAAHDKVFTLHRKFIQATGEFQAIVRFIGPPEDKDKFKLEFSFLSCNQKRTYLSNICADTENVEDAFQSSNCVLLERQSVGKFLRCGSLVCEATIIFEETVTALDDKIKALFSAEFRNQ